MSQFTHFISVGKERLRCGYTTGTCAAAAARGAAELLLRGTYLPAVRIDTPAGIPVDAELEAFSPGPGWASCAVRKDGGDDPDITDGALIFARAEVIPGPDVVIDGGPGVGRVTRPGLDQPPGAAAINSTPRRMIAEQVRAALDQAGAAHGLRITISVPEGERLAKRTFNPRLGIEGGISILGTSGIVRPMSEAAIIDSVRLELNMVHAAGGRDVLVTPGNYGASFSHERLGLSLKQCAQCSNYVGEAIDYAAGLGFQSFLLVGHLGKLCKVASGIMNTHSHVADGRRESLTAHAALAGAAGDTLNAIFHAATTDAVVDLLDQAGLREAVMRSLAAALGEALEHRAGGMAVGGVFLTNQHGLLGMTPGAAALMERHRISPPEWEGEKGSSDKV